MKDRFVEVSNILNAEGLQFRIFLKSNVLTTVKEKENLKTRENESETEKRVTILIT